MIGVVDEAPKVNSHGLPQTPLQGEKFGLMAAYLLLKGYTLRPLKEEVRPYAKGADLVVCVVENDGVPVAFLAMNGNDQVGFVSSQFGLQFIYDSQALVKSAHWPTPPVEGTEAV